MPSIHAVAAASLVFLSVGATAQEAGYPNRPITLVVGFAPGGGTDQIARILAPKVGELLKQTIIVDNKAGASGTIAASFVAKAPPDGYTLLMGHVSSNAMVPAIKTRMPYAAERDFTALSEIGTVPQVLAVPASLAANNIAEFIALAKSHPGKLNYASSGLGTQQHFAAELFQIATKTQLTHVPYKGSGPALIDLMAGQVDVNFDTVPSVLQQIKSGKVKALAVTTRRRSAALPDVPTLMESGLTDYDVSAWYMAMAPAGLSPALVAKISGAFIQAAKSPDIRERLGAINTDVVASTPEEARIHLHDEIARWSKIAREKKISED